jgi:hypothetical protein
MTAMPAIDIRGMSRSSHAVLPWNSRLKISPATIGRMVILVMSHIIDQGSIGMYWPAIHCM